MDKLGIECTFADSDAMNHVWNMVKLDGEWYHVDVTWDDPAMGNEYGSGDQYGSVRHNYLLLSDKEIYGEGDDHYDWYAEHTASSTKYDEYFWCGLGTPVHYYNGNWYFASDYGYYDTDAGINKYSFQTETVTNLINSYSIECMDIYNGYAYILTNYNNIYAAPINDIKNMTKITEIAEFSEYDNLDGVFFENGYLHYALADEEYYMERDGDFREKYYDDYYKYRYTYSINLTDYKIHRIKWNYVDETLTVNYNGELPGYDDIPAPWEEYADDIKYIKLENVTGIGSEAFYGYAALKCLTLPSATETIGERAFYNCKNLNLVFLGENIKEVSDYAFSGCRSLAGVFYSGDEEQWEAISFGTNTYNLSGAEVRYNYVESKIFKLFDINSGIVMLETDSKAIVGEPLNISLKKYSNGAVSAYSDVKYDTEDTDIINCEDNIPYAVGKGRTKIYVTVQSEEFPFYIYSGETSQMYFENTGQQNFNGILIAASYLADGVFAGCAIQEKNMDVGEGIYIDYIDYGGAHKGFAWNSLENMQPVSEIEVR